ncbi:MAG: hypothetical protein K6E30_04605 [Lachnospiraceae bacterium]|nr:hypothetical protein [Lachnospiraceae bacterium]
MNTKKILLLSLLSAALLAASGCGKKNDVELPEDSVISVAESVISFEEEISRPDVPEGGSIEEITPAPDSAIDTSGAEGQIVESLPDYLKDQVSVTDMEAQKTSYGEGFFLAPGSEVKVLSDAQEGQIGETVIIKTKDGDYSLTIDSFDIVDTEEAGQVIQIFYTYENLSIPSEILVGDYGFAMTGPDRVSLSTWYNENADPELSQPTAAGESSKGALSYYLTGGADHFYLYYHSTSGDTVRQYIWKFLLD